MKKPNIIICMADQLRPFETGLCRHPAVQTPAMERLAGEGPWFATACSNSPLCVPARSVLLSGQYTRTCTGTASNFVGFPPSRERVRCIDPTLPEMLRRNGYRTGLVGKWHLHPAPDLVGFDEAIFPHNLHRHYGQSFYDCRGPRDVPEGFSLDYELAEVERFIGTGRNSPFFLQYNLSPPHMPLCDAPARYTGRYRRDQVVPRGNVTLDGRMAYDERFMRIYMWDYLGYLADNLQGDEAFMSEDYGRRNAQRPQHGLKRVFRDLYRLLENDAPLSARLAEAMPYLDFDRMRSADLVDLYRFYYGMVNCVDDYLAGLLRILDDTGLGEETILVFTSDHGDQLGSHHLWQKAYLYEESIRIPLLFRWPGRLPPSRVDAQLGSLVDIAPTLLSLARLPVPPSMQGQDLSPVLRRERETLARNAVFIEAHRHGALGLRTPTAMYGLPLSGGTEHGATPDPAAEMYFDLQRDPLQLNSRPGPEDGEAVARLRRELLDWHRDTPWLRPRA